jgi:hypothetical protein
MKITNSNATVIIAPKKSSHRPEKRIGFFFKIFIKPSTDDGLRPRSICESRAKRASFYIPVHDRKYPNRACFNAGKGIGAPKMPQRL